MVVSARKRIKNLEGDKLTSIRAPHGRNPAAPEEPANAGFSRSGPIPRIALNQQEACIALGCSDEFFVAHIRPCLRVFRRGRKRLFLVRELERALDEASERAV